MATHGTLEGHTGAVKVLAAVTDDTVATGSADGTIKLWRFAGDAGSAECVSTLTGHAQGIRSMISLPGGAIVSGSGAPEAAIKVWEADAATGAYACVATLPGGADDVSTLCAISSSRFVSACERGDKKLRVWQRSEAGWALSATLEAHTGPVLAVKALSEGMFASAGGDTDCSIRVWRPEAEGGYASVSLQGHEAWVSTLQSFGESMLVSCAMSPDKGMRLWNVESGVAWVVADARTTPSVMAAANVDGATLALADGDSITVWRLARDDEHTERVKAVAQLGGHEVPILCIAATPGGRIVAGCTDGALHVWQHEGEDTWACSQVLKGHDGPVLAACALRNGVLVTCDHQEFARFWRVDETTAVDTVESSAAPPTPVPAAPPSHRRASVERRARRASLTPQVPAARRAEEAVSPASAAAAAQAIQAAATPNAAPAVVAAKPKPIEQRAVQEVPAASCGCFGK